MLSKLEWASTSGSEQQLKDVIAIVSTQDLDREYLFRWAAELGVDAALEEVLRSDTG